MQCYGENITFDDKNESNKKTINEDLSNDFIFSFIYFILCELLFSYVLENKVFIYPKH